MMAKKLEEGATLLDGGGAGRAGGEDGPPSACGYTGRGPEIYEKSEGSCSCNINHPMFKCL